MNKKGVGHECNLGEIYSVQIGENMGDNDKLSGPALEGYHTAVKTDDAEVPVYLWDQHIWEQGIHSKA